MAAPTPKKPVSLKLDLPIPNLQPPAWIPNPETSKLASVFTERSAQTSTIYCSQCKSFFNDPTIYLTH
ncbi:hypothetical protein H4R22_005489, partial [Coemansia sp. RSA 1290]